MNLRQLQALREVMLTGSVSQAARNLARTQPAVSSMIASLERDIGLELFVRRAGRLHPVPEAHFLLAEANAILDRLAAAERTMRSVRDLQRGTIRIVTMPGPGVFLLPDLISRFVGDREGIKAELLSRSSPQVQQLVSVQQYDLGLADLGLADEAQSPLVSHEVFHFECLCALGGEDPLARCKAITARDLSGKPMAALYAAHPTHVQTRAAFEEMGAALNICFETQYFIPLLTFVERRLAYALVDPLSVESYRRYRGGDRTLVFRHFRPQVFLSVSVMTPLHRPLSTLARAFTATLKTELRRIESAQAKAPVAAPG